MGKTQIYGSITEVRPLAVVHLNTTFDHSYLLDEHCLHMITFSWSLSEFMMNVVKSTTLSTKQEKPEKVDIEAPICWPTLELSTHHRQDTVRTKWKRNRLLPGGCAGSREKTPWKEAKFWKSFVGLTGTLEFRTTYPHQMSKAPAAPFSNCTWLLLKKRPGNFYQNGPKIQTATESSKHEQERCFKQLTPMLPRASRHCKGYTRIQKSRKGTRNVSENFGRIPCWKNNHPFGTRPAAVAMIHPEKSYESIRHWPFLCKIQALYKMLRDPIAFTSQNLRRRFGQESSIGWFDFLVTPGFSWLWTSATVVQLVIGWADGNFWLQPSKLDITIPLEVKTAMGKSAMLRATVLLRILEQPSPAANSVLSRLLYCVSCQKSSGGISGIT